MEWLADRFEQVLYPPTPQQQLNRASLHIERDARRLERARADCDAREKRAKTALRTLAAAGATHSQLHAAAADVARARAMRDQVCAAQGKLDALRSRMVAGGISVNVQNIMSSATEALAAVPAIANPLRARAEMANYERMQLKLEAHDDVVNGSLDDDAAAGEAEGVLEEARVFEMPAHRLPGPLAPRSPRAHAGRRRRRSVSRARVCSKKRRCWRRRACPSRSACRTRRGSRSRRRTSR